VAQLWAIRHGQASLFSTDYDVLSERGEAQARDLGAHLAGAGVHFDRLFSGPAKRQKDTASLAREAAAKVEGVTPWPEPVVVEGLDEHDAFGMMSRVVPKLADDPEIKPLQAGIAEAKDRRERSRGFQRLFEAVMTRWLRGEIDAEDAETWPAFKARVLEALETVVSIPAPAKRIAAFSSVGPLAVLLQRALNTEDLPSFQTAWRIRNASITRFEFSARAGASRLTLDGFNTLPHLPNPDTWTFR